MASGESWTHGCGFPAHCVPRSSDARDVYDQYETVLDISRGWDKGRRRPPAEIAAASVAHAIVHAEYEEGDFADAMNDELAQLVASDRSCSPASGR